MQITFELDKNRCTIANNSLANGFIIINDIDLKQKSINEIINKVVVPKLPIGSILKDYVIKIYNDNVNLNNFEELKEKAEQISKKTFSENTKIETLRLLYIDYYTN